MKEKKKSIQHQSKWKWYEEINKKSIILGLLIWPDLRPRPHPKVSRIGKPGFIIRNIESKNLSGKIINTFPS